MSARASRPSFHAIAAAPLRRFGPRRKACADCGAELADLHAPAGALCDPCDASSTVDRVLESVARFKARGAK